MKNPKYSIVVPSYNGGKYLSACISTILSQSYLDFELIVSDDHSTDGSREYLSSLNDQRLKILTPTVSMSMAEHWEWALSHAKGEWQIFVGQDDGLQPYFFELADKLTSICRKKKLRAIMSSRAYYFWPGTKGHEESAAVFYTARPRVRLLKSKRELLKAICGKQSYFDLPTMYTTSLFHWSLIEDAKRLQGGDLFSTHPQDANLAAISMSLEKRYLLSEIPLGWVGTSPRSAGAAVTVAKTDEEKKLKTEYLKRTAQSRLKYNSRVGDFNFASLPLYLWGALLETERLRRPSVNRKLASASMTNLVMASVLNESEKNSFLNTEERKVSFLKILESNKVDPFFVQKVRRGRLQWKLNIWTLQEKTTYLGGKLFRKLLRKGPEFYISYNKDEKTDPGLTLERACDAVGEKIKESRILERM